MTIEGRHQIGEAADSVGLSIRTIRHYDELGIVEPSGRTTGGFRLYTDGDVDRLRLVKRLKPLGFSLEEIQELLGLLERRGADMDRLAWFVASGEQRCESLREQLDDAEDTVAQIRAALGRGTHPAT